MRTLTIFLVAALIGGPSLVQTSWADDKKAGTGQPKTESMERVEERVSELTDLVAKFEEGYAKEGYYDLEQKEAICKNLHQLWAAAAAGLAGQQDAFRTATGGGAKDNAEGGVQKGLTPDQTKWKERINDADTKLEGLADRIAKLCPHQKRPGAKVPVAEPPNVETPLRVRGDPDTEKTDPKNPDPKDSQKQQRTIGVIAPQQMISNEPFTFAVAASGVVEGEVIDVRTIEGEVIQRHKADKLGRVFLPAGLAAGAYLITRDSGKHQVGTLKVQQGNGGSTLNTSQNLSLQAEKSYLSRSESMRLTGTGVNPNAAKMSVSASGKQLAILASTRNEMVIEAPLILKPGTTGLTIHDNTSGNTLKMDDLLLYDLKGQLTKRKLAGGERTTLELQFEPKNMTATLRAEITDGPIRFVNGQRQAIVTSKNGRAEFAVITTPGSIGTFHLTYRLESIEPLQVRR